MVEITGDLLGYMFPNCLGALLSLYSLKLRVKLSLPSNESEISKILEGFLEKFQAQR